MRSILCAAMHSNHIHLQVLNQPTPICVSLQKVGGILFLSVHSTVSNIETSLLYDDQVTYNIHGAQITQGICRKIITRYAFYFWHFYIICIFISFLHWLIDNCKFIKHCELQALHSLFCEYFSMHVLFFRLQVNNTHLDKTRSLQVACRRVIVS